MGLLWGSATSSPRGLDLNPKPTTFEKTSLSAKALEKEKEIRKQQELQKAKEKARQQEAQKALREFYRNGGGEEVFIPDWQGNGEWVSVGGGDSKQRGLSHHEIRNVLDLFQSVKQFRPTTTGKTVLAAITCYWKIGRNTDHWTAKGQSSTGVPLRQGIVAVDPEIIPYGSLVLIEGIPGGFIAADCGSHVSQRVAVKKTARTECEKKALVIDVYFVHEKEGRAFDGSLPKFVKIHYFSPSPARST